MMRFGISAILCTVHAFIGVLPDLKGSLGVYTAWGTSFKWPQREDEYDRSQGVWWCACACCFVLVCAGHHSLVARLCPCRRHKDGQVALPPDNPSQQRQDKWKEAWKAKEFTYAITFSIRLIGHWNSALSVQLYNLSSRLANNNFFKQLGLIGPRLTFVELFSLGTVQFVYRMFWEKLSLHDMTNR